MNLSSLFSFSSVAASGRISEIFPFETQEAQFITDDVTYTWSRILLDVVERTEGLSSDELNLVFDNCVASEKSDGLLSLLAKAMTAQSDLYLVYRSDLKVIREANQEEKGTILADYKKQGSSKAGVYITFKNLHRSKFLKIYASLEYTAICALSKNLNLSKAIQIKIENLRGSVSLADKAKAESQGTTIADALSEGEDILLDAKDMIEMLQVDIKPTEAAMDFINTKRSFYLGLPAEWITGLRQKGLSDTGKADSKSVERGLKPYYSSIMRPVFKALFNKNTTFKSEEFEQASVANETLKSFELTGNDLLSQDNKLRIINKLYGLPADSKGDAPKKQETPPAASSVNTQPKEGSA